MFGGLVLGSYLFGQITGVVFTPLAGQATIPVACTAPLQAAAPLAAAATVAIATAGTVQSQGPLFADTTLALSVTARLAPVTQPLAATLTIPIGVIPDLTVHGPLVAAATVTLSSGAALQAASVFAGTSVVTLAATVRLSTLPATFASHAAFTINTTGNVLLVGLSATNVLITFNGVVSTPSVRVHSISITDILNEAPNSCTILVDDPPPPSVGTDVKIGLQNLAASNLLFAGTVKAVDQYYEPVTSHPVWSVRCDDYTYLINRRQVIGTWRTLSATQIALDILARFTSGFSGAGIASGLPTIDTITFDGVTVMDALTQIANSIGGYAGGPDYTKTVWLFITDPRPNPTDLTPGTATLMLTPPVRRTADVTQTRTRIWVHGASTAVSGPADFTIGAGSAQIPLEASTLFTPGQAGNVLTEDAQVLTYSDIAPGGVATVVRGNVPAPLAAPITALAAGVAGGLVGTGYQWKVAFANSAGETEVGPASSPPLTAPTFPIPAASFGIGPVFNTVGPLVGAYDYAVTFVTSLGETLPSTRVSRTAAAVPAAGTNFGVTESTLSGHLAIGQTYRYVATLITTTGETAPSAAIAYTPSALAPPGLSGVSQDAFGGITPNSQYTYGVTNVTALGESAPPPTMTITSSYVNSPSAPTFINFDTAGRIGPGSYVYAASWYSDAFGETPLGPSSVVLTGPATGTPTVRFLIGVPGLGSNADGIRIYRGLTGGNPWQLNADFRRGNVPANYWDPLSQGECGNPWPIHQNRNPGVRVSFTVYPSSAPGVIARRIYRSQANRTDLQLLAELQHNQNWLYTDVAFDSEVSATRPALTQTGGRQALVQLPVPPFQGTVGYVGRRVYRTKANGATYSRIADLREMTSTQIADDTPDESLTGDAPPATGTAGGEAHVLTSIPIGPTGTLARRIYRTVSNGTELRLLVELGDNLTTQYTDTMPDAQLSNRLAPLTATAGAAAVQLSGVPRGGAGVTQRVIYRTKAGGGATFLYVGTLDNNTDTTFLDDKRDDALGRPPMATSTIGALAGDTAIVVTSAVGWPVPGWFKADAQVIRYTGITLGGAGTAGDLISGIPPLLAVTALGRSGQTAVATTASAHGFTVGQRVIVLGADQPEYNGTRTVTAVASNTFNYLVTGTPASPATGAAIATSAPGAITGAIAGGTTVVTVPMLIGVSGISTALPIGSSIALWIGGDGPDAQRTLAALEGGDGVHEYIVNDSTIRSVAQGLARCNAELLLFQDVQTALDYTTRDPLTRSGALITVNLPAPQNITGTFRIQEVRIDQIDIAGRLSPRYSVHASNTKYSLNDLLRHVVLK